MVVPNNEGCEERKDHKGPIVHKGHRGQDSHTGYTNPVAYTKVVGMALV